MIYNEYINYFIIENSFYLYLLLNTITVSSLKRVDFQKRVR